MDPRHARSRTSSTSSLRSHNSGTHPATPSHTPSSSYSSASFHPLNARHGDRSSIPPTPAPTPNPLLHVVPEQLAAGIKQLRVDEGYVDSSSFPATPAPSPFSPSPHPVGSFSPDQVAERLRQERLALSGASSSGQPPTPSTTPGPGMAGHVAHQQNLVPEHLAESIHNLRGAADEGLDSASNPATPVQTPISPAAIPAGGSGHGGQGGSGGPSAAGSVSRVVLPEQLAAGIHRLKVEEGMSSGGSSGFPSTPAPTPLCQHPGGVKPEDLAAGISRLSVIEESDAKPGESTTEPSNNTLSSYFKDSKDDVVVFFSEEDKELPSIVTNTSSDYATPNAATPVGGAAATPIMNAEALAYSSYTIPSQFATNQPITSPLQQAGPVPHVSVAAPTPTLGTPAYGAAEILAEDGGEDETDEATKRRRSAWLMAEGENLPSTPLPAGREELPDPVRGLVQHYRGEAEAAKRFVLTANHVSQDMAGLRQLLDAGCLRAAVNLTTRILVNMNGPVSSSIFQVWLVRISLLVKLKHLNTVDIESASFGNLDRYRHDDGSSAVPFSFRLLMASVPSHLGKPLEALDRLYAMISTIDKMLANLGQGRAENGSEASLSAEDRALSAELWRERRLRVLYSLANCAIRHNDFDIAASTLDEIADKEASAEGAARARSLQGRVFLRSGDLAAASRLFEAAAARRGVPDPDDDVDGLVDRACLAVAANNYADAYGLLARANERRPDDPVVVNDMSVCLLYLGRLADALSLLETHVTQHTASTSTSTSTAEFRETPMLNLATLYELESSYAGQKKQSLLDLMSRTAGDGVNTSCLKL